MCGIAGIVLSDRGERCSEQRLVAMRDVMTHRGPDDQGLYINGNIGLAHRRLSIIDLSTGHQPMLSADENLVIVFNGEIYNYRELRKELEGKGRKFKTHSDTEVILAMYQEYGKECVAKLNGIFAFAILDMQNREVFLARDHMGVKPLYYSNTQTAFVFASEAKSLFESGYIKPECNQEAVPEYFLFRHVAGDRTLFKNINVLPPGYHMTIRGDQVVKTQYWSSLRSSSHEQRSFHESLEALSDLFTSAVKMQMMSDVPLGTFCSGGVDSSLVTAIAAQNAGQAINTFSVGFYEEDYDETKYARLVSSQYDTNHHEIRLDEKQFTEYLPRMIWYNDEPLNFANSVHIFAISQLAKEHVTVVLTGEGSDELFGGYPRYQVPRLVARMKKLPSPVRNLVSSIMGMSGDHRWDKLKSFLSTSINDAILFNSSPIGIKNIKQYWPNIDKTGYSFRADLLSGLDHSSCQLEKVSKLDQNSYLVSILNRQDKMSMAASIESRVPFLDYRVVEFANSLPAKYKINGFQTKHILKKLAERYLPREVIYRRKSGFGVPLPLWLKGNGAMGKMASELFVGASVPEMGEKFNIQSLYSEHCKGSNDHSEILWTTLNFLLWKRSFGIQ